MQRIFFTMGRGGSFLWAKTYPERSLGFALKIAVSNGVIGASAEVR